MECDKEDVRIEQLTSMVQTHHKKIHVIEQTLAATPNAETLRNIEHVFKELPNTDDMKSCVKSHTEKSNTYKKIFMGVMAMVLGTLAVSILAIIWQGVAIAMKSTT